MDYLEKCYSKDLNIVSRRIVDEIVLVPIRQNVGDLERIYTLNEVGAFIWDLIDGKRQIREIKEMSLKEFDVDDEDMEKDLIEFILQLENLRVVLDVSSVNNQLS